MHLHGLPWLLWLHLLAELAALAHALHIPDDPRSVYSFACQIACLLDSLLPVEKLGEDTFSQLLSDQNLASIEDDSIFNGKLISVTPKFLQVGG